MARKQKYKNSIGRKHYQEEKQRGKSLIYIKVDITQGWQYNGKKTRVEEIKGYITILGIRKPLIIEYNIAITDLVENLNTKEQSYHLSQEVK